MTLKCILLCLIVLVDISLALYVSPKIMNSCDDDIIINAGESYILTCQGNEPLIWNYPKVTDKRKEIWTSFRTELSEESQNNSYTYRSVLHITNMSYPFVGFYTCLYEGKTNNISDQIYLYINDPEHLSIIDSYPVHFAVQYQETTIPCRPTNPDVQVKLISHGTDEHPENITQSIKLNTLSQKDDNYHSMYQFDTKKGFWTNDTLTVYNRRIRPWKCEFRGKNQSQVELYKIGMALEAPRLSLATPYIEDNSYNHTDAGQTLNLTCSLKETSRYIDIYWITPRGNFSHTDGKNKETIVHTTSQIIEKGDFYLRSIIIINDTTVEDSGVYRCIAEDRQDHVSHSELYVMVYDTNPCYSPILEEDNQRGKAVNAGANVTWILKYAHPVPKIIWSDNNGNKIKNDNMYHTDITPSGNVKFTIKNVTLENDGPYKICAIASRNYDSTNCTKVFDFEVVLNVYDKPVVCLDLRDDCKVEKQNLVKIYQLNEIVEIKCKARGNPLPKIIWTTKNCVGDGCDFIEIKDKIKINNSKKFVTTSSIRINTTKEGVVSCMASNSIGTDKSTMTYYISDIQDGFDILNFSEGAIVTTNNKETKVTVALNSTLTFTCAVSPKRSDNIEVFHNDELLSKDYIGITNDIHKAKVYLPNAKYMDSGKYSCRILNLHNQLNEYKNVTIEVKDPELHIWKTNLNEEVVIEYPNTSYELYCSYTGVPKANVKWFKDNKPILPSERIILAENDSVLKFVKTHITDEGLYRCKVSNSVRDTFMEAQLTFKNKPSIIVAIYYYITGTIGLLLMVAIIYIIMKGEKEKALRRELKSLGLENFYNGNPEYLNPELAIGDQAELLPYNKKWEFPIEQLKLGKQLGSGAFGVVMKAEARRIIAGEERSTVAVKMVKKNADQTYIKALVSELKIMVHLGKHINVVNLVGACTKNVAKRELLVIVEYCRFGNLQNYLFKHRASFINQVDQVSGKIDYDIGTDILERTFSSDASENCNNYTPRSMQDYRQEGFSNLADTQYTSEGDETVFLSNNSIQPEWRLNYKGDYKGQVKPVCTSDLMIWSFQIARGMEYLALRKVLHGDLATRNILLADNNVIKICDFGLAKTMYNDNNYKKKGNSPLPIKWMAIESITDRVFSTQSDVWSFGIVLWELFSLAETPYPGIEADERLYYKLTEGYRMKSPVYAPKEIYRIMLASWNSKPLARPSFTKLVEQIGILLEESVQKHYIHLNDPYLKMNTEKLQESDYLAMLSPPSIDVLSSPLPHYINANEYLPYENPSESKSLESRPEGYLFMGTNDIFSQSSFEDGELHLNAEKENHDIRPMLQSYNNESDTETGYLTPITPLNSLSNPSYHIALTVPYKDKSKNNKESVRTPDNNYITMPQYRNLVNGIFKDGVDKSLVKINIDKDKEIDNYMNTDAKMWNPIGVQQCNRINVNAY